MDRAAYREVVRRSRLAAYPPIVSPAEIEGVHDGALAVAATWGAARAGPRGLLVAEADGRVVGGAELELLHDGAGEVGSLYVLPEDQGRGGGTALWDGALDAFRARGVPAVQVWAVTRAAWARRFYEGRGAVPFGTGERVLGEPHEPHVGYRLAL